MRGARGVRPDLGRGFLEAGLEPLVETHGLRGGDVHERSALGPREDGGIELLGKVLVVREDETATRTAEALVCRRRDEVGVLHRRGMNPGGDESGDVSHVDEEEGTDRISDFAHAFEIDDVRVGRGPGRDHLRLEFLRGFSEQIVVDRLGLL